MYSSIPVYTEELKAINKIQALKDSLSAKTTTTPLWVFLYLYERAEEECYGNYMAGAKALYKYLSPIESFNKELAVIPSILYSYETAELSKVTGISEEAIITCILEEVMPRLESEPLPSLLRNQAL